MHSLSKKIYDDGGIPDVLIVGSGGAGTLHGLMDSSSFIRVGQENTVFGMMPVARINTQFHTNLQILTSLNIPANKAYMLDSSKVGLYALRPFFDNPIAKSGDYMNGEVIGEFSLMVANNKSHGYIQTSNSTL